MRLVWRSLAGALVALVVVLLCGTPTWATEQPSPQPTQPGQQEDRRCTCQTDPTPAEIRVADVVLTGTITTAARESVSERGDVFVDTYEVAVDRVYKGQGIDETTSVRSDRILGGCGGTLAEGGTYMFFLRLGNQLRLPGCSGTDLASAELVAMVEDVRGPGRSPRPVDPVEALLAEPASGTPGEPRSYTSAAAPGLVLAGIAALALLVVRRFAK